MSLSEDRLALLYRISQTFNSSLDLSEVLNRVMDEVITAVRAERGFVVLRQADGAFRFAAARGLDQQTVESPEFQVSRGIVDRVAAEGMPLLTSDAQADVRFASRASVRILGVRAILCVPLELKGRIDGVVYVDSRLQAGVFSPEDLDLLKGIAASAAIAIENARLYQVAVEKGRMERELQVAREVQSSLLPQGLPAVPGWEFAAWWQPREVSGDFYDFVRFQDGVLGVVVGDVTDKGMPAALFMANARSVLRANVAAHTDPALALRHANEVLCTEASNGMFVTLLLAKLGHDEGKVVFANAGNNCPLLFRGATNGFADVGTSGFPLGIDSDFRYVTTEADLAPGDFLLQYTDGLIDANDPQLAFFGRERLLAALRDASRLPALEMRERLRQAVAGFIGASPPYDDVTFVIARRTAD